MVLLSLLSITTISQSRTNTNDSSTSILNRDLKKGADWIEQGKMTEQLIQETNKIVDSLNERIAVKESIIDEYEIRDTAHQAIIETYRKEVDNLVKQRDIATEAAKKLDKLLRRQKRKTIVAIVATAVAVGGICIIAGERWTIA